MTLTSDVKDRKQRSQHNRPNLNNNYKTKKNFAGFYTEVNPLNAITTSRNLNVTSRKGGAVASWLVRSTPERAFRVQALTEIVLCSWARHETVTVPLSTQEPRCINGHRRI